MLGGGDHFVIRLSAKAVAFSLLFFSSGLFGSVWVQEESSESIMRGFYPNGDYVLEIDGAAVPDTTFYMAERIPAVMILAPDLPYVVLMLPRTKLVQTTPSSTLTTNPDSSIDVIAESLAEQGKLRILASWIVFSIDDQEWTLKPRPWLLGPQDIPSMLNHNPEYVWRSKAYSPDPKVIEELEKHSEDANVRIFFGSWCSACKRQVPKMVKVASQLTSSRIQIEFYGLPNAIASHPVAGPLMLTGIPAGIVSVDGKEVGRIFGGQDWESPEVRLKAIVQQRTESPDRQ
jgi:thiol-disulfide isomerase/thioredoxin